MFEYSSESVVQSIGYYVTWVEIWAITYTLSKMLKKHTLKSMNYNDQPVEAQPV
jgi:hypothetical protein